MKIFVINLESATERRSAIDSNLKSLNLSYDLFKAVKVQRNDLNSLRFSVDLERARDICCNPISLGELGCTLSHLSLYSQIVDQDIGCACILEDDASCNSDLPEILRALENSDDWELIMLGHWSLNRDSMTTGGELAYFGQKSLQKRKIGKPAEFPLGTHAYVISKKGAEKLLAYGQPARMPADFMTGSAEKADVQLELLSPPVVTQKSLHSTIKRSETARELRKNLVLLKMVKRVLRRILLVGRKIGFYRKSYIWLFNPRIS